MKTYGLNEAAAYLNVDRDTAGRLAADGDLPGAKIGRAWVFRDNDLDEYLLDQVRRQTAERRECRTGAAATVAPRPMRGRRLPELPGVA